eukprot:TRINITY_DN2212_c4_g1_i1.p1 TRINITY_DN2212_c4_g1~~TRINITY_DN2212_c4_g1_i1.p1  ORF type:complete len:964 (+),score=166.12 TRINITY_DN2212_c4_g1_i1:111-3002(+)
MSGWHDGGTCWDHAADRFARLSDRPGDSPLDRARKRAAVAVCAAGTAAFALLSLSSNTWDPHFGSWPVSAMVGGGAFLACVLCMRFSSLPSASVTSATLAAAGAAVLMCDLGQAAGMRMRLWPCVVIILQVAQLFSLSSPSQVLAIVCTVTVLAVERIMAAAGSRDLYDSAGPELQTPGACNCALPPCTVPWVRAVGDLATAATVLLAAWLLTRCFAASARFQGESTAAAIRVTQLMAEHFAQSSADEAAAALAAAGDEIPAELREALDQMVHSLRVLCSSSVLSGDGELASSMAESCRVGEPPGTCGTKSHITLVFTDIESSTALWDAYPQGMYDALDIHNRFMRRTTAATGGYEVKTIGDAFMLAFASVGDACAFALDAQQGLLRQQWPRELLQHPLCRPQCVAGKGEPVLIWNGLRVRVGINCGEVRVELNPVSGRFDYFGGPVNVAARVESAVRMGGLIGVTDAVLGELGERGLEQLGCPTVNSLGLKELKGLPDMELHVMTPAGLAGRMARVGFMRAESGVDEEQFSPTSIPGAQNKDAVMMMSMRLSSHFFSDPGSKNWRSEKHSNPSPIPAETRRQGTLRSIGYSHGSVGTLSRPFHTPDSARFRQASMDTSPTSQLKRMAALPQLRRAMATCAVVRSPLHCVSGPSSSGVSCHLSTLEVAADSSGGVIATVLSSAVVVTWNASKGCTEHVHSCSRFLRATQREHKVLPSHVGVATGQVSCGNVPARRRLFQLTMGGCIQLSAALAAEAELCADRALAVGPLAKSWAGRGRAHWAQVWQEKGAASAMIVWELELPQSSAESEFPRQASSWEDVLCDLTEQESPRSKGDAFTRAFFRIAGLSATEQQQALRSLGQPASAQSDPTVVRLLQRAARGTLRSVTVPPLLHVYSDDQGAARPQANLSTWFSEGRTVSSTTVASPQSRSPCSAAGGFSIPLSPALGEAARSVSPSTIATDCA